LRYYKEIPKLTTTEYEYQFQADYLREIILDALRRNTNSQNLDKVIDYYQKLYQVTDDSDVVLRQKMQVLKLNNHEEAYLAAFSAYFDSYVQKDKNLIESLDSRFNKMYDYGWIEFKNNFANECNVAAWFVVEQENKDNKKALTDAIKWSEISLMIEKDNYFYLDTLAQLYYLNGQKALAISTQEKALDFATRALGSETATEFKIVLEKMKNNTY
jgi:tetratricopeptide (TPR) repeat protein